MPIKINNFESSVNIEGDGPAGGLSASEVERIVKIVMERIREEQGLQDRMNEETRITNKVSLPDLFD